MIRRAAGSSLALLALLSLLGDGPLAADPHANVATGFSPEKSFQIGDVDHVNLFNGNLVITIPIGISYPVGGGFSHGLSLIHNSNPWFFPQRFDMTSGSTFTDGQPSPCSNAGLGWRVSFGEMNPLCDSTTVAFPVYQDASGADHTFFPNLHNGEPTDGVTQYTRDGTYLRLQTIGSGDTEIDFPDGSIHHFQHQGVDAGAINAMRQRLVWMKDAFGNRVDVEYEPGLWTITDTPFSVNTPPVIVRTHKIVLVANQPSYAETVSEIDLAGLGRYTFGYTTGTIARACPNDDTGISPGVTVPFLSTLTLPDGAGNITQIGADRFLYDGVSRLTSGSLVLNPADTGTPVSQTYAYDAFGNIQSIGGTDARATPTSPATNRLNGAGTTYDAAGNLTAWNGATYEYDDANQLKHYISGSEEWLYMYDADDERLFSYKPGVPGTSVRFDRWTIRDLAGKVLRTYEASGYNWTGSDVEDSIYRDGLLLAAELPPTGATHHFHLDHLGTPRLITDQHGVPVAYHVYYPFGEEATAFNQDTERMKFTGHERDLASAAGAGDDLDYMHARHCSPVTGRFLSVDRFSADPLEPLTWNRYTYARANPLKLVDPNGLYFIYSSSLSNADKGFLHGALVGLVQRPGGRAIFQKIAADKRGVVLRVESLNKSMDVARARFKHEAATLVFGSTSFRQPGSGTVTSSFDRSVISEFSTRSGGTADKLGITTMAHELYHADKSLNASFDVFASGDQPSNATGPAQQFGERVDRETPDMGEAEAGSIVGQGFNAPSNLSFQEDNFFTTLFGGPIMIEGVDVDLSAKRWR